MSRGLNLRRGENESIFIENTETEEVIRVKVLEIDRGQVKLGLDAPQRYGILRGELPRYNGSEESK